jgi:hypothetical protein
MKSIKIDFADFWSHFNKEDNYIINLLRTKFIIEISNNPDFLIYSCYGTEHLNYSCYRVFYNGENLRTNWNACDFAFGFDYVKDERYFRLPNWIWYENANELLKPKNKKNALLNKTGFCSFVVSNPNSSKRIDFFNKLSKYKKVDSGGRYLNNIGRPVENKLEFISRYKFNIAFENSSYPGYTTEKIIEPLLMGVVPIYWGNKLVTNDFNRNAFLNYNDFKNDEDLIEKIIELDNNDDSYAQMYSEPSYLNNTLPSCLDNQLILQRFEKIFGTMGSFKPVATTHKKWVNSALEYYKKLDNILNSKIKYRENFR